MPQSSITDLLSFFSDFLDFCRSAHEAVVERRRKRAERKRAQRDEIARDHAAETTKDDAP